MNPQGNGEFLAHLSGGFRPDVQIQTVLAEGSLLAIAPLGVITTGVLNGLITRTTEGVTDFHALPGHDGLGSLPTVLADGRRSIGNATIDIHIGMVVGQYALYLTALNR